MQIEWIVGGVVLLVAALAAKMMLEQLMLQRLGLTFTFLWATLMALHFWRSGMNLFGGVAGLLRMVPREVVSFWLVFLLAAVPGIVLVRLWLRTYDAVFPFLIERLSAIVCTLLFAVGMPSLVVMTAMLMPPRISRVLPSHGFAGALTRKVARAPVRFYLSVADTLTPWEKRQDLEKRHLPARVRQIVLDEHLAAPRRRARPQNMFRRTGLYRMREWEHRAS